MIFDSLAKLLGGAFLCFLIKMIYWIDQLKIYPSFLAFHIYSFSLRKVMEVPTCLYIKDLTEPYTNKL